MLFVAPGNNCCYRERLDRLGERLLGGTGQDRPRDVLDPDADEEDSDEDREPDADQESTGQENTDQENTGQENAARDDGSREKARSDHDDA